MHDHKKPPPAVWPWLGAVAVAAIVPIISELGQWLRERDISPTRESLKEKEVMKTVMMKSPLVEVTYDGHTVWVNDETGYCIGRFSVRLGALDVHSHNTSGGHCLDCGIGTLTDFIASMLKHHGVRLKDALHKLGAT